MRLNYLKAIFMFKLMNDLADCNPKEFFQENNDSLYPYNLRYIQSDLAHPMPKKDFGKRCFNYMRASL